MIPISLAQLLVMMVLLADDFLLDVRLTGLRLERTGFLLVTDLGVINLTAGTATGPTKLGMLKLGIPIFHKLFSFPNWNHSLRVLFLLNSLMGSVITSFTLF